MDSTWQDLRFAARSFVKQPAFSALVVATLALGIGAATAIFSIVDGILLRPLPFMDPQRLVAFNETTPGGRMNLAWPNFLDFKERSRSFSAVSTVQSAAFTTQGDRPQRIVGRYVTASFLDVLGVQPLVGRAFRPEDDVPGAPPVALVSHAYWQQSLNGDANVLGRPLPTAEHSFTIVGVLPPRFRFGTTADLYAPIGLTTGPNAGLLDRGNHFGLFGVARLAPGVTREQAQAELERIAASLGREHPKTNTGAGAEVQMLRDRFVERVAPTLVALMGSVAFLLLLACANVANLLLARGAARQHELVGDKPVPPHSALPMAAFVPVTAGYFETVAMAVRDGRVFDLRDRAESQPVAIVNETAARRLWPGESALGKRLKQGWPEEPGTWREVVGIVSDVKLEGVDQDTPLQIFLPLPQVPGRIVAFVVRTSTEPEGLAAALEAAVQRVQPDLPVARILAMTRLMTRAVAGRRLSTMIFGVFAALAMLIAAVGLYGVVSQSVTERTREIGVRMALGAERRRVLGMFVRQGLVTTLVGIAAGTAGALMLSKWIEQLVFNVAPRDPATLGAVAGLLFVVSALACYVPARRATRVDPLIALRAD